MRRSHALLLLPVALASAALAGPVAAAVRAGNAGPTAATNAATAATTTSRTPPPNAANSIPPRTSPAYPAYRAALVLAAGATVYVDPSQDRIFDRIQADQVRGKITRVGGAPIYVAILPGNAARDDGEQQLKELTLRLGYSVPATIAVVTGGRLRAASTAIPYAQAQQFADEAIAAHETDPLEVKISDFIDRVAKEEGRSDSGGTGGVITGVVLTIVVFGGGGILLVRRKRRWRELQRLRPLVEDDLTALARELLTLPEPEATSVREPLARATGAFKKARGVEHLPAVAAELAAARRAVTIARSQLAGEVPPADRPACFFDPRHGASAFDVDWAPPGGAAARTVPACAVDAQRVRNGLSPVTREVEIAEGRQAPWFEAGPEFRYYLAPGKSDLLAGLPAGAPLRARRWQP